MIEDNLLLPPVDDGEIKTRYDQLKRNFNRYNRQHPDIWDLFVRFTFMKIELGYKHYSTQSIIERVRWETDKGEDGVTQFKISNCHGPFYAELFEELYPENKGFFRRFKDRVSKRTPASNMPDAVPDPDLYIEAVS